jgi:hypothetical protein
MSCLGKCYNPQPPRDWSRVQGYCEFLDDDANAGLYLQHKKEIELLKKGNVLQYKKNSSNLTKGQRYSKIARGKWTNRTTTWATQSQTYSNPNTKQLKRVGSLNIIIPGQIPTNLPVTCNTGEPTVIQDGGHLVCSIQENVCTGETVEQKGNRTCNLTTDCDVPGKIETLCWNNRVQTWYPRQRLNMSNSANKWPVNSKAIFPIAPCTSTLP